MKYTKPILRFGSNSVAGCIQGSAATGGETISPTVGCFTGSTAEISHQYEICASGAENNEELCMLTCQSGDFAGVGYCTNGDQYLVISTNCQGGSSNTADTCSVGNVN